MSRGCQRVVSAHTSCFSDPSNSEMALVYVLTKLNKHKKNLNISYPSFHNMLACPTRMEEMLSTIKKVNFIKFWSWTQWSQCTVILTAKDLSMVPHCAGAQSARQFTANVVHRVLIGSKLIRFHQTSRHDEPSCTNTQSQLVFFWFLLTLSTTCKCWLLLISLMCEWI